LNNKYYCEYHQPKSSSTQQRPTELNTNTNDNNHNQSLYEEAIKNNSIDNKITENTYLECNVTRDEHREGSKKLTSSGFLATFFNCGVIVGFDETPRAEGIRRVLRHLIRIRNNGYLPPAMLYDTACTLKLFINKWFGTQYLTETDNSRFFKNMNLAIDRFHLPGHTREMCRKEMDPDNACHNGVFQNIDSQICERTFSYLTNFKHAFRQFGYPKSVTFYLLLFHLKNCQTIGISPDNQGLGHKIIPPKYRL
ncbi:unnamed protein product, partial [Didymodactylos carnosus]